MHLHQCSDQPMAERAHRATSGRRGWIVNVTDTGLAAFIPLREDWPASYPGYGYIPADLLRPGWDFTPAVPAARVAGHEWAAWPQETFDLGEAA